MWISLLRAWKLQDIWISYSVWLKDLRHQSEICQSSEFLNQDMASCPFCLRPIGPNSLNPAERSKGSDKNRTPHFCGNSKRIHGNLLFEIYNCFTYFYNIKDTFEKCFDFLVLLSLFQTSAAVVNIWLTIYFLMRRIQKAQSPNTSTNNSLAKSHLNSSL